MKRSYIQKRRVVRVTAVYRCSGEIAGSLHRGIDTAERCVCNQRGIDEERQAVVVVHHGVVCQQVDRSRIVNAAVLTNLWSQQRAVADNSTVGEISLIYSPVTSCLPIVSTTLITVAFECPATSRGFTQGDKRDSSARCLKLYRLWIGITFLIGSGISPMTVMMGDGYLYDTQYNTLGQEPLRYIIITHIHSSCYQMRETSVRDRLSRELRALEPIIYVS